MIASPSEKEVKVSMRSKVKGFDGSNKAKIRYHNEHYWIQQNDNIFFFEYQNIVAY
jgi:hypothetical protein